MISRDPSSQVAVAPESIRGSQAWFGFVYLSAWQPQIRTHDRPEAQSVTEK
jgi:hypothetical protein